MELEVAEEPRVMDTYALVYAFTLVALVPGLMTLENLTYRVYTTSYVALVTVPFLLGLAATFFTDSKDGLKRMALRTAVLTPLVVLTGVGLMFGLAIVVFVPLNPFFQQDNFDILGTLAALALVAVAGPMAPALIRRFREGLSWRSIVQGLTLAAAIALVVYVLVFSLDGNAALTELGRKDSVIYLIGALTWYLPAFGFAAGWWRRTGLV